MGIDLAVFNRFVMDIRQPRWDLPSLLPRRAKMRHWVRTILYVRTKFDQSVFTGILHQSM